MCVCVYIIAMPEIITSLLIPCLISSQCSYSSLVFVLYTSAAIYSTIQNEKRNFFEMKSKNEREKEQEEEEGEKKVT